MKLVKSLRGALGTSVFLVWSVPAALHLYAGLAWFKLTGAEQNRKRIWVGDWFFWARNMFKNVCWFLRIKVEVDQEEIPEDLRDSPFLIISNHRTFCDIPIIMNCLANLGRKDLRWILKKALRWQALYIGRATYEQGCAFIARKKSSDADKEELLRGARVALEDGACLVLFPEGTRFSPKKRKLGFRHLLPPKPGGFLVMKEVLKGYPVMSVAICWRQGRKPDSPVASGPRDARLIQVKIRIHRVEDVGGSEWLTQEWQRMDNEFWAESPDD